MSDVSGAQEEPEAAEMALLDLGVGPRSPLPPFFTKSSFLYICLSRISSMIELCPFFAKTRYFLLR